MNMQQVAELYGMDPAQLERELQRIANRYRETTADHGKFLNKSDYKDFKKSYLHHTQALQSLIIEKAPALLVSRAKLDQLVDSIEDSSREINRPYNITQKKDQPNNRLVLDLVLAWERLTDKPADTATGYKTFQDFIEHACEAMSIESKGLYRRYLTLREEYSQLRGQ